MTPDRPRYYSRAEWEALTDHDREVVAEERRRAVEDAAREHAARAALLESLTVERFSRS
jgi:hypothetical protein